MSTSTGAFHSHCVYLLQPGCDPACSVCFPKSPVFSPPLYRFLLLQKLLTASAPFSLQWLQHFSPSQVRLCISLRCPSLPPPIKLPLFSHFLVLLTTLSLPQGFAFIGSYPSSFICCKWPHCLYGLFLLYNFTHPSLFTSNSGHRNQLCPSVIAPPSPPSSFFLSLPILPSSSCIYPSSSFAAAMKAKLTLPVFNVISFLFLYRLESHSAVCHFLNDGSTALFLTQWNKYCPRLHFWQKQWLGGWWAREN